MLTGTDRPAGRHGCSRRAGRPARRTGACRCIAWTPTPKRRHHVALAKSGRGRAATRQLLCPGNIVKGRPPAAARSRAATARAPATRWPRRATHGRRACWRGQVIRARRAVQPPRHLHRGVPDGDRARHTDAGRFAARAVEETQFTYNKGNKPQRARGSIGSVLFTFKQFIITSRS